MFNWKKANMKAPILLIDATSVWKSSGKTNKWHVNTWEQKPKLKHTGCAHIAVQYQLAKETWPVINSIWLDGPEHP